MSDTLTLDADTASMLATIAASLNGGRFAHLATDATVKGEALARVAPIRAERRRIKSAARQASKRERLARDRAQRLAMLAEWSDYSESDLVRIESVYAWYSYAPKRSLLRMYARRLFRMEAPAHTDTSVCACPDCLPMGDWRATVRLYAAVRTYVDAAGSVGISRFDMTPTVDSRFYRNVVKHWHQYAGGRHVALHGVTPDDVFQDAMVAAIAAGDVTADNVPTFGSMYVHTRHATESAVYAYRRGHSHAEAFTMWTWADWEAWASERIDPAFRVRYSTDAEWQAYAAAAEAHAAEVKRAERVEAMREAYLPNLNETRQALANLVRGGMTVRRIANLLGRTPEAIAADLEANPQTDRHGFTIRPVFV